MDRGVGVAVGDVDVAIRATGHVRRMVERRLQLGMLPLAEFEPKCSQRIESHYLVAVAIDQHDQIVR